MFVVGWPSSTRKAGTAYAVSAPVRTFTDRRPTDASSATDTVATAWVSPATESASTVTPSPKSAWLTPASKWVANKPDPLPVRVTSAVSPRRRFPGARPVISEKLTG